MPNKGHSDEKIAFALRQVEAGKRVAASTRSFRSRPLTPGSEGGWRRNGSASGSGGPQRNRKRAT